MPRDLEYHPAGGAAGFACTSIDALNWAEIITAAATLKRVAKGTAIAILRMMIEQSNSSGAFQFGAGACDHMDWSETVVRRVVSAACGTPYCARKPRRGWISFSANRLKAAQSGQMTENPPPEEPKADRISGQIDRKSGQIDRISGQIDRHSLYQHPTPNVQEQHEEREVDKKSKSRPKKSRAKQPKLDVDIPRQKPQEPVGFFVSRTWSPPKLTAAAAEKLAPHWSAERMGREITMFVTCHDKRQTRFKDGGDLHFRFLGWVKRGVDRDEANGQTPQTGGANPAREFAEQCVRDRKANYCTLTGGIRFTCEVAKAKHKSLCANKKPQASLL